MARHRKSPRPRRNLMVIDPLTLSQGHQFDPRLKFISVSWSTALTLKFDMPHDYVQNAVLRLRGLIYHMRVFFLRKRGKSTIICVFKLRGF